MNLRLALALALLPLDPAQSFTKGSDRAAKHLHRSKHMTLSQQNATRWKRWTTLAMKTQMEWDLLQVRPVSKAARPMRRATERARTFWAGWSRSFFRLEYEE